MCAPTTLPLLAELEMAALAVCVPSKAAARLLDELGQPKDATGARALLVAAGHWQGDEAAADVAPSLQDGGAAVEPFPRAALDEAAALAAAVRERRAAYAALPPSAPPPPPPTGKAEWGASLRPRRRPLDDGGADAGGAGGLLDGRVDLRSRCARAYAIDADSTEFRDDAVSFDVETNQLYVHIADVAATVAGSVELEAVARLRLQSTYMGGAPLHMLPPSLLKVAGLSADGPNECVTAILQLDPFGRVRHAMLVRSLVPPVRQLTFDEMDTLLADRSITSPVHDELRALETITARRAPSRQRASTRAADVAAAGNGSRRREAVAAAARWRSRRRGGRRGAARAGGCAVAERAGRVASRRPPGRARAAWSTRLSRCSRTRAARRSAPTCRGCRRLRTSASRRRRSAATPTSSRSASSPPRCAATAGCRPPSSTPSTSGSR